MGCPALKNDNVFDIRLMPANSDTKPATVAKELAEMYGLRKERHLTMDGNSPGTDVDFSRIMGLAQTPHISLVVNKETYNDMRSEDLEMTLDQLNLQLDLIEAAGDMVDQMEATIQEITQKTEDLTQEQKEKFVTVIENTHTLDMANDGRIALPTAEIMKLGEDTLEIMQELFNDDILPDTLKEISLGTIEKTAIIFQLPDLETKVAEFKQETSEISKLQKTIEALKATLGEILAGEDIDALDDEGKLRQEIEDALEKLENLEDGKTLDNDTLKMIESLSKKITDTQIPQAAKLASSVQTIKTQNILSRSESLGLKIIATVASAIPSAQSNFPTMSQQTAIISALPTSITSNVSPPSDIPTNTVVDSLANSPTTPKDSPKEIPIKPDTLEETPDKVAEPENINPDPKDLPKSEPENINPEPADPDKPGDPDKVDDPVNPDPKDQPKADPDKQAALEQTTSAPVVTTPQQPTAAPEQTTSAPVAQAPQQATAAKTSAPVVATPQQQAPEQKPTAPIINSRPTAEFNSYKIAPEQKIPNTYTQQDIVTPAMAIQQDRIDSGITKQTGLSGICNGHCAGCKGCSALSNMMKGLEIDTPTPKPK